MGNCSNERVALGRSPQRLRRRVGDIFSTFYANGVFDVGRRPGGKWVRGRDQIDGRVAGKGAVIDDDGNVTVAYPVNGYCPADGGDDEWGNEPNDFHIEARFLPFGKQEWRRFRLPGRWDGCAGSVPALDVDARGTVTAVWSAERKVAEIPDGTSSRGEHLSLLGTSRASLLAAWSDYWGRDREWYSRVRFAGADRRGHWRSPRTVERIAVVPNGVAAVVTAAHGNRAVLAWHVKESNADGSGPLRVRVRTRGAWSSSKLLDRRADHFGVNGVAATDAGAVLVWNGGETGSHFPLARTRRWAGAWEPVQLLSSPTDGNAARAPWVVTWKPNVFTAAFSRGRETWSAVFHVAPAH